MKTILFLILITLTSSCSMMPNKDKFKEIYYTKKEIPLESNPAYGVYLIFIDDTHFSWWRTNKSLEAVVPVISDYLDNHPGASEYTKYEIEGYNITGTRTRNLDIYGTSIQKYNGTINGNKLDLILTDSTIKKDGSKGKTYTYKWNLEKISIP